jgi:malate synthase
MTQPFLKAYSDLLVQTCHRRGAHAMGGMAAQVPIAGDDDANARALARVRDDKLREVGAGFDGTWVAHPALIPLARSVFDADMPGPHQQYVHRNDVAVTRDDLVRAPHGSVTRGGFDNNVEVCVRYLAAWLDGQGCVPIHWLMEDAATAEIARAQLWQWLHHTDVAAGREPSLSDDGREPLHLADGTPIDFALFERALIGLPGKFNERMQMPGAGRIDEAIALLDALTHRDTLEDFLTLPAYDRID